MCVIVVVYDVNLYIIIIADCWAWSHSMPYLSGIPYARDRHVAELATCTTHSIHKRQISMSPAGLEPAVQPNERPQTHALDRAATWIGVEFFLLLDFLKLLYSS